MNNKRFSLDRVLRGSSRTGCTRPLPRSTTAEFRRGYRTAFPSSEGIAWATRSVFRPALSEQVRADSSGPIEAHQTRLASEADTLATIRDALLPKLISGEIRVPDTADPDEVGRDWSRQRGVMTPYVATEDTLAEQPALARLCDEHGWTHVHGSELAPDAPAAERKLWSDVVLVERLRRAVARINPQLPPEAVRRACDLALTTTSPSVIEDHRSFHELLLSGVPVAYRMRHGQERYEHARLVDFEEPANNEFLAVNQLTIIVGAEEPPAGHPALRERAAARPDRAEGSRQRRTWPRLIVNQVRHYAETIPPLYRYVEIVGASDYLSARVGTITTPAEHFAEWKTMSSDETERARPQLELMIDGVFAPARFLDLIRDFVFFETDGAKTWKVLAKYHQVDAVNAAVESVAQAMGGDRRGGVVWHTQGAGKSYTMVFFVNKLRRDPRFGNPTIVAVTDRTDLDNQLADTFTGTHLAAGLQAGGGDHRRPEQPARAAQRAGGRDRVHDDPEVRASARAQDAGAV